MIAQQNLDHTLFPWSAQGGLDPISMVRAEGLYFWDEAGKRYLDWNSQLMNVNIGHGHPKVIEAIQRQAAELPYATPSIATRVRGEVGEKLARVLPGTLHKALFTTGGADAIESAIRIARLVTGRRKIVTRYRSYHGATAGAASAGGDPRRLPAEPFLPGIVRVQDPYRYRCQFCRDREACTLMCEAHIEETIQFEGPETVAAVLLEGWSGSSGLMMSPRNAEYFQRLRAFCDRHGILLIADEVMSGFGRTGKMFAIEHAGIAPDIMALAKGLTCGYAPLGATVVSAEIARHFESNVLNTGMTYAAHPLCLAAASACLDVYEEEQLVPRAAAMGEILGARLDELMAAHPSVGEARGIGLFWALELVRDRATREPLSPFNAPPSPAMRLVAAALRERGLFAFVRWNLLFCAPPLTITREEMEEALAIIDEVLEIADDHAV